MPVSHVGGRAADGFPVTRRPCPPTTTSVWTEQVGPGLALSECPGVRATGEWGRFETRVVMTTRARGLPL